MIEFARRGFIGGILTLIAVRAVPLSAREEQGGGNYHPRIFGNGRDYDSDGFQALFDNQQVVIPADKLRIVDCKKVILTGGIFVIDKEVWAPYGKLEIERGTIDGRLLKWYEAFFSLPGGEKAATNPEVKWLRSEGHGSIYDGSRMFGTNHLHIADINRMRPAPPKEI